METARQVLDHVGGTLVVTQTILVEQYRREIHDGLTTAGIPVHHFLLETDQKTLAERIETDTKPEGIDARQWRLDHLADYERALSWLRQEAQVMDASIMGSGPSRSSHAARRVSRGFSRSRARAVAFP